MESAETPLSWDGWRSRPQYTCPSPTCVTTSKCVHVSKRAPQKLGSAKIRPFGMGARLTPRTKPYPCVLPRPVWWFCNKGYVYNGKGKVKVHTLDIAPLRSESPPQKRSGMARVLKGFHSFTCTPTRSSAIGMSHTCLCLPSYNWYSFTDPSGMEG